MIDSHLSQLYFSTLMLWGSRIAGLIDLGGDIVFGFSNLGGYVYPAFCSFKAIESISPTDDSQW